MSCDRTTAAQLGRHSETLSQKNLQKNVETIVPFHFQRAEDFRPLLFEHRAEFQTSGGPLRSTAPSGLRPRSQDPLGLAQGYWGVAAVILATGREAGAGSAVPGV